MFFHNWHWKLATKLIIWSTVFFGTNTAISPLGIGRAMAQEVVPDNTLPNNSVVDNLPNNITEITGGTRAGGNLFHSFERFGVPSGAEVHFQNTLDINNIINRVTGGNISNINGLIKANGSANLFLINPAGIVFGENARFNIGGSFIGSTADSIKFADDMEFSATNPENTPLLTVNVPLGLQYGKNPGNISVRGTGEAERTTPELFGITPDLEVPAFKTLALIGGDVLLEGTTLKASSGRIELGSVFEEGLVSIAPEENGFSFGFEQIENFGEIQLSQNTAVDATGNGAGEVRVTAKNLTVRGDSVISSTQTGTEKSAGILINATESVNLNGGIDKTSVPSGLYANNVNKNPTGEAGGNITINTPQLTVADGATITTNVWEAGDGGDININASNFRIEGGGKVSGNTAKTGNGGNLNIEAQDVQVVGELSANAKENSTGNGGDLNITTNNLRVENGGKVSATTNSSGNGGNLNIEAQDVEVVDTGNNGNTPSELSAKAQNGSTGNGGDLNITTNNLLVKGGAFVAANTFGKGNGGNITINPTSENATSKVEVIGKGGKNPNDNNQPYASGLFVVGEDSSTGNAGNLTINTKTMRVEDGAFVSASNNSQGSAGNLKITTNDLLLKNNARFFTGRVTEGKEVGELNIKTNNLLVEGGSSVQAGTSGKSGDLIIDAQDIQVIGTGGNKNNTPSSLRVSTNKNSTGDGGNLNIKTQRIIIKDGAFVAANTFGEGNAGNLVINALEDLKVIGKGGNNPGNNNQPYSSGLFATAEPSGSDVPSTGNAGNLTINTKTMLVKDGAIVSASTNSNGNAGKLTITATDSLQVLNDGSKVFAGTSGGGNGGSLIITTDTLQIKNGAEVSNGASSTGDGGDLTIDAKTLEVIGMGKENTGFPSKLSVQTNAETNSKGNAGNLTINTQTLKIKDGAEVGAGTFGEGRGGKLTVEAEDIEISDTGNDGKTPSTLRSSASQNSKGDAGEVDITTKRMLVEDGAFVAASTEGEGNGGNLIINAEDLQIIGFGGENPRTNQPYPSGLYASADEGSTGNAGDLTINTKRMLVEGGAQVAAGTFSEGDAGNLTIDASDVVELIGIGNNSQFETGLFARSLEDATGDAGNLTVNTKQMLIKDQAQVAVESFGTGNAGNLNINAADSITLNQGTLSAESETGVGGNINLDINELLLLRNNSLISAISRERGTDGNITINTGFIVAFPWENSDIVAFGEGRTPSSDIVGFDQGLKSGSNIGVFAQGILGIEFRTQRTPESDIVATGDVTLNIEESEPEINSIELPEIPLESRFNDVCEASTGPNPSTFYYFGNGGIPIGPWDYLQDESIDVGWVPIPEVTRKVTRGQGDKVTRRQGDKVTRGRVVTQNRIVEATGWIVDENGDIYFVADASHETPPSFNNPSCLKNRS